MKAIILVGGQGTRLRPLTLHQPKPLLPILNQPFLKYQLDNVAQFGIDHVVLAAGPHINKWKGTLKKIKPKSLKISISVEKKPLGTAGAIKFAYDRFLKKSIRHKKESILVLNGDIFSEINIQRYLKFHLKKGSEASLAVRKVKDVSRFGLVLFDANKRIMRFREKPKNVGSGYVNAGAYILNASFVEAIPNGPTSIERETFPQCLRRKGRMFGFVITGYWNDIGTPKTYLKAHKDLFQKPNLWTEKKLLRKRNILVGKGSRLAPTVKFDGFVSLGRGVRVGRDTFIKDSVVLDGCQIGSHVEIKGTILGKGCKIGSQSRLSKGTVLGDKTKIKPFTQN